MFLLETMPGMQFRSRMHHQGIQAALTYFRNVVEAHNVGRLHQRTVEELLGPGNALPYFEKSLRVISPSELLDVSPKPIGRGANGTVYQTSWQKPQGVLVTTNRGRSQVPVVLKHVLPANGSINALHRLSREVGT